MHSIVFAVPETASYRTSMRWHPNIEALTITYTILGFLIIVMVYYAPKPYSNY